MKAPLISLSICAALLVVAFGLCGLRSHIGAAHVDPFLAGLVLFGLSILGGAASLLWLLIAAIRDGSRR